MVLTWTPMTCSLASQKSPTGKNLFYFSDIIDLLRPQWHYKMSNSSYILILISFSKLYRRAYLDSYLAEKDNIKLISTSASPILGVHNSMTSSNEKVRKYLALTISTQNSQNILCHLCSPLPRLVSHSYPHRFFHLRSKTTVTWNTVVKDSTDIFHTWTWGHWRKMRNCFVVSSFDFPLSSRLSFPQRSRPKCRPPNRH